MLTFACDDIMACYSPIREPCEFQSRTGGPGETREVETNLSNPYIIPTQPIRNGQTATAAEPQVTTDNKHARRGLLNHKSTTNSMSQLSARSQTTREGKEIKDGTASTHAATRPGRLQVYTAFKSNVARAMRCILM